MRTLLILLLLAMPFIATAQDGDFFEEFLGGEKGSVYRNLCVRGEIGWNRSWFLSAGISHVWSRPDILPMPASFAVYAAGDINLAGYRSPNVFYSYKAGFEYGSLACIGAELRNNTDFAGNNHLIFMPKGGITFSATPACYMDITYTRTT